MSIKKFPDANNTLAQQKAMDNDTKNRKVFKITFRLAKTLLISPHVPDPPGARTMQMQHQCHVAYRLRADPGAAEACRIASN